MHTRVAARRARAPIDNKKAREPFIRAALCSPRNDGGTRLVCENTTARFQPAREECRWPFFERQTRHLIATRQHLRSPCPQSSDPPYNE